MNGLLKGMSNVSLILFYTIAYWAVGLTEEEYHIRKAGYWINLGNHRRAIRNYQKSLNASEDSRIRATMAWCYAEIGLLESSREHYQRAFNKNKAFDIGLGLAYAEVNLENYGQARTLVDFLKAHRSTRTEEQEEEIAKLEAIIGSRTKSNEIPA